MSTRDEQGTGKHPHKSTQEPYPHTKGESDGKPQRAEGGRGDGQREQQAGPGSGQGAGQGSGGEGGGDLKSREYRDEKGETHHHTRTYQEQHKGE